MKEKKEENPGVDSESNDALKLKKHSSVWNFLGFKNDDDAKGIMSNASKQCFGIVAALRGNTTNLYDHLQRLHELATKTQEPHQKVPAARQETFTFKSSTLL